MAIKIRKQEENPQVLEPEVLPPEGEQEAAGEVKLPGMDDDFLRKSSSIMAWIMENRRMVIFVTVVIVAIAFGILGVTRFIESQATKRSSVMTDAFVTFTALTKDEAAELERQRMEYMKQQGIAADAPDILHTTYTVPDNHSRFVAIEKYLKESLVKYPGESIETTGQLMLAGTEAKLHPAAEVKPAYDKAMQSLSPDVQLFAMLGQAEMLVGEQKYDEAISLLDQINIKYPTFNSHVMLEKGRIYEMTGATDKAIEAYKAVFASNHEKDQQKATIRLRYLTPDWSELIKTAATAPAPVPAPGVPNQAEL